MILYGKILNWNDDQGNLINDLNWKIINKLFSRITISNKTSVNWKF